MRHPGSRRDLSKAPNRNGGANGTRWLLLSGARQKDPRAEGFEHGAAALAGRKRSRDPLWQISHAPTVIQLLLRKTQQLKPQTRCQTV